MGELANSHMVVFLMSGVSLEVCDGIGTLEREAALYLAVRPHVGRLTFVTYGGPEDLELARRLPGISVECNRWRLPSRLYVRTVTDLLSRRLDGHTIIKAEQMIGAELALRVAARCGAKFVARCGYLPSSNAERIFGPQSSEARAAQHRERLVLPVADRVVVTTETIKQEVIRRYGVPAERIRIIPNYVQTDLFRPRPDVERVRGRICFVGRLDKEKNLGALLEAANGLEVELVLVGSGPLMPHLKEAVRQNGLRANFLGNVPNHELPEIFNSSQVFVLPSFIEGHPKSLIEAMSCGLAVLGTNVPGIRDVLMHRRTGYLCGTEPGAIRAALLELLRDEELRNQLGKSAREYVLQHYTLDSVVERELALLRELV